MNIPERLPSLRTEMKKGGIDEDRQAFPQASIRRLTLEQAGASTTRKIGRVRAKMYEYGATHHIIAALDEISWLFNICADNSEDMKAVVSYTVIETENVLLFINKGRLSAKIQTELMEIGVVLMPYNGIHEYVRNLSDKAKVLIDPRRINDTLYKDIPAGVTRIEKENPAVILKTI